MSEGVGSQMGRITSSSLPTQSHAAGAHLAPVEHQRVVQRHQRVEQNRDASQPGNSAGQRHVGVSREGDPEQVATASQGRR
jgi:hypothetical protein